MPLGGGRKHDHVWVGNFVSMRVPEFLSPIKKDKMHEELANFLERSWQEIPVSVKEWVCATWLTSGGMIFLNEGTSLNRYWVLYTVVGVGPNTWYLIRTRFLL
jgi:hypothetical protein